MNTYTGENTKTMHARIMIKTSLFTIFYSFLMLLFIIPILCWLIYLIASKSNFIVVAIVFLVIAFVVFITFILILILKLISLIRNIKILSYYKNNPLTNIQEILVEYDYKKWLNAPRKTFLSIGLYMNIDEKEKYYDAGRCFTNNTTYYLFPKFKIPKELIPKNYTEAYTIVGFDPKGDAVIIGYKKF